jgi:hypothetical protein
VIPWKEWLPAFVDHANLSFRFLPQNDIKFEFLKLALSVDAKDEMVTIENWANLLEWFGPLEKGSSLLDRVFSLRKCPKIFLIFQ